VTARALLPITAAVAALAVAAPTAGAAQPVLDGEGMTATRTGKRVVFHFADTARGRSAFRRVAGREVMIKCESTPDPTGDGLTTVVGSSENIVRVPKRRGPISVVGLSDASMRWCSLRVKRASSVETVAVLGVTAEGRTYVDRVFTAGLLFFTGFVGEKTDRSIAAVVGAGKGLIVALDGPDGTPPQGRVGYWTDGQRTVSVAVAKDGYRLFLEVAGDAVRTNALPYLNEEL
jgi:hypothetical protein